MLQTKMGATEKTEQQAPCSGVQLVTQGKYLSSSFSTTALWTLGLGTPLWAFFTLQG